MKKFIKRIKNRIEFKRAPKEFKEMIKLLEDNN